MAAALVAALLIGLPLGALCVVRVVSQLALVVVRFFKEIGQSDRENAKKIPAGSQSSRACGALEALVGTFFSMSAKSASVFGRFTPRPRDNMLSQPNFGKTH